MKQLYCLQYTLGKHFILYALADQNRHTPVPTVNLLATHRTCKLYTSNQRPVQHQLGLVYHLDTIFAWLILSLRITDTQTVYLLRNLYADNSSRIHVCMAPLERVQQCHGHCISHMSLAKLANLAGKVAPGLKLSANAWLHTAHNSHQ